MFAPKEFYELNEAELAGCWVSVTMMQAIEYKRRNHLIFDLAGKLKPWLIELGRNSLLDALIGPMLIVILNKSNDDAFELILVEDEKVVKALPFHCANQAFTMSI